MDVLVFVRALNSNVGIDYYAARTCTIIIYFYLGKNNPKYSETYLLRVCDSSLMVSFYHIS